MGSTRSVRATREHVLALRLRRHHLTRRLAAARLPEVLSTAGVRNTPPGSAYGALRARLAGVSAQRIDDALANREIVEVLGPRMVPTLVTPEDVAVFTVGAVGLDEQSLQVSMGEIPSRCIRADGATLRAAVDLLVEVTRDELDAGPRARGDLSAALTRRLPDAMSSWCERCGSRHVYENLFRLPGAFGVYCVAPRSGREVSYVRLDRWLTDVPPPMVGDEWARLELLRRFLCAYGPTKPAGFADWARTSPSDAGQRFADLADDLATVVGDDVPEGVMLARDRVALGRSPLPVGARLLPPNDPYLLGRDRATIVPDSGLRKAVWPSVGQPGTVLVDGEIVGTWRAQQKSPTLNLQITSYRFLPERTRSALDDEARAVAVLRGAKHANLTYQ